jgi:hypothetical protein
MTSSLQTLFDSSVKQLLGSDWSDYVNEADHIKRYELCFRDEEELDADGFTKVRSRSQPSSLGGLRRRRNLCWAFVVLEKYAFAQPWFSARCCDLKKQKNWRRAVSVGNNHAPAVAVPPTIARENMWAFETSIARVLESRDLSGKLNALCQEHGVETPRDAYTRWCLTCRPTQVLTTHEWVLPCTTGRDGGLEFELRKVKLDVAAARSVAVQMGRLASEAVERILNAARNAVPTRTLPDALASLSAEDAEFVRRATALSDSRRKLLRERFDQLRVHANGDNDDDFERRLFCMLSSYAALNGEIECGEGYHVRRVFCRHGNLVVGCC